MTLPQQRALAILRDAGEALAPKDFARLMWPGGYEKWGRCGIKGVAKGTGATMKAGAFLESLVRLGLVARVQLRYGFGYHSADRGQSNLPP